MTQNDLSQVPAWFPEDQREPEFVPMWTCKGTRLLGTGTKPVNERWLAVYRSKEEAEAGSCIPNLNWEWNRKPAVVLSLKDAMAEARADGLKGVRLKGYENGEWVTLKEWLCEVPLSEEDQEL